jgi:hypothetical protein
MRTDQSLEWLAGQITGGALPDVVYGSTPIGVALRQEAVGKLVIVSGQIRRAVENTGSRRAGRSSLLGASSGMRPHTKSTPAQHA